LPTRQAVIVDRPHPPVELVTIAASPEPCSSSPARALRVPVASAPDGPSRSTTDDRRRV
jgi:hypothetical protein